jgi:predicted glycogen debranching enzyme
MREWIVTNGLGGYASLTYQNTNTRKYHGLLVASLHPPTERWMFVTNVFDEVKIKDKIFILKDIKNTFNFDLIPSFTYEINDVKIRKTVCMQPYKNTTFLKYEVFTDHPVTITHNPLINSRHCYDVNTHRNLTLSLEMHDDRIFIKPENSDKTLKIFIENFYYEPRQYWEELFYLKDRERNDSWIDNNIHIGKFQKTINKPIDYYLVFTVEDDLDKYPADLYSDILKRKAKIMEKAGLPRKFEKLVISTDNFIVKKAEGKSIIAGYHWFGDWGRDTLIALPGLCLVTNRFNDAKQILLSFSKYLNNGLIPNAFMERDSEPVYNTVDASLWYIDRVFQYIKYTNDMDFLKKIWPTIKSIFNGYKKGTDFNILMDKDYLISHDPGLTWMDVKIDDYYPTPRTKKAVEIQALWYNGLKIMSIFAKKLGEKDIFYDLSIKVKDSFNKQYDQQYDVIDIKDRSFRPNQIFLVSLDFSMIDRPLQIKIVNDIKENLLTIFGLRTLSKDDERYKGKYIDGYNKEIAYHNGTVWPWLLGPFIRAFVKVNNYHQLSRRYAYEHFLKPMFDVFGNRWDGSIFEIFDGDPIYEPRGCISQAWSVAEILRSWVEDIENTAPTFENMFIESKLFLE